MIDWFYRTENGLKPVSYDDDRQYKYIETRKETKINALNEKVTRLTRDLLEVRKEMKAIKESSKKVLPREPADNTVIVFSKGKLSFAALNISGRWWITSMNQTHTFSWVTLLEFIGECYWPTIHTATEWEKISE